MPDNSSSRHQLPYLVVAQAQKEMTHNEAITMIDALLHPTIVDRLATPPQPLVADAGKCWLVAASSTGLWQSKSDQIALWAAGSWRYLEPVAGMSVRNLAVGADLFWNGSQWIAAPTVVDPQSGSVVDVEARAALTTVLAHFRTIGLFASLPAE